VVTAAARDALAEAVKIDPRNARARYYLAIAKEQDGDGAGALASLQQLLADAPPEADWTGAVRARMEQIQGDASRKAVAALPEAERQQAIKGMVDGLTARLAEGGGTLPEWTRLIRARTVLGDKPAALQAVKTARERLAQDATALAAIDALADELALKETAP
jgi:cytochrome c-type biogenesis protein CcmH